MSNDTKASQRTKKGKREKRIKKRKGGECIKNILFVLKVYSFLIQTRCIFRGILFILVYIENS
jgi:hypothetical protein